MKALITGVSGFIGRALASLLVENGWEIVGTSRHPTSIKGVRWKNWDVGQQPDPSLFVGVDVIFHLAGKAHAISENQQQEAEYDTINYGGTERLLHAANSENIRRVVYFSSVKAVGDVVGVMDTSVQRSADTPYGRSKHKSERLLFESGLVPEPVVLRPSMVYGPTHKGNLPRMIRAINRGLFPPLPDNGNRRSMVHVNDVARAALLLATDSAANDRTYIVTDGHGYSIRHIQQWIYDALQRPAPHWTLPLSLLKLAATIGDGIGTISGRKFPLNSDTLNKLIGDARYNSEPLQTLGFKPQHSLQASMPDIVRFLLTDQGVAQ